MSDYTAQDLTLPLTIAAAVQCRCRRLLGDDVLSSGRDWHWGGRSCVGCRRRPRWSSAAREPGALTPERRTDRPMAGRVRLHMSDYEA